ncbi:Monocarboxylate 2-oxoacid-binding periplasmic protein precursor [Pseudovibrio sp. W64]|uniref:TRAP transporter substrate-binding protein n=1 Tax=unclassified Pseudovibrio TaxID=2627060 RepID=UPI00070E261C|nr:MULTISPECIES: TRAP transporter substrate-binding protein [unclassified Pseudovibrio]KZK78205.1 Monocarboxylate 2-oxoacid-binding periplasmic protein precursor [Pseudovibrio sp. W64]KZK84592.1 Monocarboxylate 2-oxoacid-binding periplasmic protein precursor [Pseudovibrio sp. Ad13]KZK92938.1 Monocarboxylate 2-oxoacid-binding periplasmic protein precursor [Pseudovibrio sp. Ad5]KZK98643.1 Monocarboxylate 2-oxoacid-binding periplasmic protein precursor [Pseudovibrio sp. W74]KZL09136.1 Monocarboxy
MKKSVLSLALAASVAASVLAAPIANAADKLLLKTPIAFSTSLPGLGSPIPRVADQLKLMSGGTIKMKVYEPGKLVPPFEILDAVSSGKINSGYTTAGYWAGKIPAAPLFSAVPFGPEAGEYAAWLYYGNGLSLYQEMYDQAGYNVKVMPCAIIAPETSGWFAKEINSPEDLKGLKMRFFGLGGKVMQKLGVATSLLPGGEIFPALEKGAIDATEFSMPAIDARLGFHKLVKYNYFPGWHQQATVFELLINKDVWNKASDTHKAIIENACKASVTDSFAEGEAIQHEALLDNVNNNGVQIKQWSPEMLDVFRSTWNDVAQEEAANDAFFAKVLTDLNQFRDNYKIWKENAFLPRK